MEIANDGKNSFRDIIEKNATCCCLRHILGNSNDQWDAVGGFMMSWWFTNGMALKMGYIPILVSLTFCLTGNILIIDYWNFEALYF